MQRKLCRSAVKPRSGKSCVNQLVEISTGQQTASLITLISAWKLLFQPGRCVVFPTTNQGPEGVVEQEEAGFQGEG